MTQEELIKKLDAHGVKVYVERHNLFPCASCPEPRKKFRFLFNTPSLVGVSNGMLYDTEAEAMKAGVEMAARNVCNITI